MKASLAREMKLWAWIALLAGAAMPGAMAQEPVAVHHPEGTLHGYLVLRSEEGKVLAAGDLMQSVHGDRVTAHTVFHFKDGSLDDETAVFTQRGSFHLISDHHIQKGPFFDHPMDMTVDARKGVVTVLQIGKDDTGKDSGDKGTTDHMKLPPDLCSGTMIVPIAKNLSPDTPETDVSMVVATPKPRLVKLAFSPLGEDRFTVAGFERKALHYEIKFKLGGVAGLIAPMIGKQPPNIEIWIEGGENPAFVKEEGPLSEGGPVVSIQQTGPEGPSGTDAGTKK